MRTNLLVAAGVDEAGVKARAAKFWARSIKGESQAAALDLVVATTDLTTLEGNDTPGKVKALCTKAAHPDTEDPNCPSVAAVCVYSDRVADAVASLRDLGLAGSRIAVASVAGAFPSGRAATESRLDEVRAAVAAGASEIDMVIDRAALLAGDDATVRQGVEAVVEAAGNAHVKAILETGELGSLSLVKRASILAIEGGAHFIKTSTGKITPAATPEAILVMLEAVRDHAQATGVQIGVKPAGGIRSAKDAVRYLVMVAETVGPEWLTPDLWRFGASTLLNDVLMQRRHLATGIYQGPDYFSVS